MFSVPIVRRELIVTSRRRGVFSSRVIYAALLLSAIGTMELIWVYVGGDRSSSFSALGLYTKSVFGMLVVVQSLFVLGMMAPQMAPIVARERDRKTLDALLSTELSSAEIILGALAGGLLPALEKLAIALPVMLLLVPLGGIDPRLIVMSYAGLASTSFAIAAIAIACSATARTARIAVGNCTFWMIAWILGPWLITFVLPRIFWSAATRWATPIAGPLIESGPVSIVLSVAGLLGGGGGLLDALARMIAWELGGGTLLLAWAIVRLRPASRAVYDAEGRTLLRRMLRTRHRPRPPVGDDPILWNERYATRGENVFQRIVGTILLASIYMAVALGIYMFAVPAFRELAELGYAASPEHAPAPDLNPLTRVMAFGVFSLPPTGFARLEFNIVLRFTTAFFFFIYAQAAASCVSESLLSERERDTWLGLIATPLGGRQILGSKILGTIWRTDLLPGLMLALWTLGLITGAVHPIGFVAVLAELGISTWFATMTAGLVTLWSRSREQANGRVFFPIFAMNMAVMFIGAVPKRFASVFLGIGSIPFMGALALLSYDDVRDAVSIGRVSATGRARHSRGGRVVDARCGVRDPSRLSGGGRLPCHPRGVRRF